MKKISGHVVWTRPISLSRAAKLISRFAAVDNGSSPAVSMYLHGAADTFNHLVQFHQKRPKMRNINSPDRRSVQKLQTDELEKSIDVGDKSKDSEIRVRKGDKKNIRNLDEMNVVVDEAEDSEKSLVKEKKKKKRKSGEADLKEKGSSKKSRDEAVDS